MDIYKKCRNLGGVEWHTSIPFVISNVQGVIVTTVSYGEIRIGGVDVVILPVFHIHPKHLRSL